jgi:sulfite exporter TauE/SafE
LGLFVEQTFYIALTIGLLGSTHCLGMCGGIVGALNANLPQLRRRSLLPLALHHLSYSAGRISSYAAAGAAAGLIGAQASKLDLNTAISIGNLIAGCFMIALGLYLAGWWQAIAWLEKAGAHVWRHIEPIGRRFFPVKTPLDAFGLGLVWGWLPCGLVYSALTLSMVSASPLQGALTMAGFGIGTLPALLALGTVAGQLGTLARHRVTRQVAGAGIILFGVYSCLTAFESDGHDYGAGAHAARGNYFGEPSLSSTFRLA